MKEEQNGPREEEYAFLQEVIKDEADSKKTWRRRILPMIGLGVVFGIAACLAFFALKPWAESRFSEDPETVMIPEDEEPEIVEEEKEETEVPGYRYMLQSLKNIANETEKSLVDVMAFEEQETWTEKAMTDGNSVSGVIIADNGKELLVLVEDSLGKRERNFYVKFCDGAEYPATLKGVNGNLGLYVCAVNREDISEETWDHIKIAKLGNSNSLVEGDTAIALGKPFGSDKARGYGLVESVDGQMKAADGDYKLFTVDMSSYENSDGIITNDKGEIIGIIQSKSSKDGEKQEITAYAISTIKRVIEGLSNGKGTPYLGIYGVDVSDEMKENGLSDGIYVKEVEADSPAMAAGIQNGDIIVNIDNNDIISYQGYHNILMNQDVGEQIVLKGLRSGTDQEYVEIEFKVKIGSKE